MCSELFQSQPRRSDPQCGYSISNGHRLRIRSIRSASDTATSALAELITVSKCRTKIEDAGRRLSVPSFFTGSDARRTSGRRPRPGRCPTHTILPTTIGIGSPKGANSHACAQIAVTAFDRAPVRCDNHDQLSGTTNGSRLARRLERRDCKPTSGSNSKTRM